MPEPTHETLRRVFDLVIAATPADRAGILERECRDDPGLRARVEAMIAAAEDDRFLAEPTRGEADATPTADLPASETLRTATLREGPGSRIGPYKLLQPLGEGGFGSVFMAEQEKPVARRVALKIIKLGMDTHQVVARFEQERQALAMMDHPNIAKVFDAGATETGRPYFVMELVKGEPISEYADKQSMTVDQRLELFAQVCNAVQHAHTKGVIHRDIKPSNVLVSTQDGRPVAKVIDFGIAKATQSKLTEKTLFTEHRQLIGTPEYMSPEQAEGSLDIDTRTDVYSLGVLLYELLTSSTPFSSRQLRSAAYAEIQRIIREVDPPKPSTRLSDNTETLGRVAAQRKTEPRRLGTIVRGELDWIVMKALEKDRQRRYETASGLAADVGRYLSGEPVLAAPPSSAYRFRKFITRNKIPVLTSSAVAAAVVLGFAGTAWQASVASRQRDIAIAAQITAAEQRKHAEEARTEALEQKSKAEAGESEAKAARALADEVAGFLRAVLGSADPAVDGADVSLVNVLRKSDVLFAARLQGQPQVELELRELIGRTLSQLGQHADAIPHQRRALALAARIAPPPSDPAQSDACFQWMQRWMMPLFKSSLSMGTPTRAIELFRSEADELAGQKGSNDPTVDFLRKGAQALRPAVDMATGSLEIKPFGDRPAPGPGLSSIDLARQRLAEAKVAHGEADVRTIDAAFELAGALQGSSEREEAAALYAKARKAEDGVRAPSDPVRQRHTLQQAIFLASRLKPAEAVALLESAIQESERVAGPGKAELIDAMRALAGYQRGLSLPDAQLKTLRAAMSIAQARLGAAHATTVLLSLELAAPLSASGEPKEAERMLRDCAAALKQASGDSNPLFSAVQGGLAHLLAAQQRHSEVVELLRPIIAKANVGPAYASIQSFDPRSTLVQSLIELERWDEAAKELEWFAADPEAQSTLPDSIRRQGARLWDRLYERRAKAQPGEGYEAVAARWKALAKPSRIQDAKK